MQQAPDTKRHISVRTAAAFVVASMIGTGVFTSLGFQLVEIQAVFPLLMLWVIGGVVALLGALTYSELAAALPRSGGEYHLLSRIIHPALGFVAGLVSATVGFSAPAVLAAMALGSYLPAVFPSFEPTWVATLCILFFHGLHGQKLRWGKLFQDWSTVVKVGLILLFIAAGLLTADAQTISLFPQAGDGQLLRSSGFAVSLVWVSYAYTGWNSTVYIAGEMIHPQRDIPRSILLSTIFVMVLYVLLNFVFLYNTQDSYGGRNRNRLYRRSIYFWCGWCKNIWHRHIHFACIYGKQLRLHWAPDHANHGAGLQLYQFSF